MPLVPLLSAQYVQHTSAEDPLELMQFRGGSGRAAQGGQHLFLASGDGQSVEGHADFGDGRSRQVKADFAEPDCYGCYWTNVMLGNGG